MRWRKGKDDSPPPDEPEQDPARSDVESVLPNTETETGTGADEPTAERVRRGLNHDPDAETDVETPPVELIAGDDAAGNDGDQMVDVSEGEQVAEDEPSEELVSSGPLYLAYAATSHVGNIRKNNQDSGYASGNLLAVADGMGGAAAGDLASAVAIESISKVDRRVEGEDMLSVLAEAIRKANDKIADLVADDHSLEGMGTTVSGVLFDGTEVALAHIGDSRGYLLRDGELRQLTHDHSWVQSLIDDGKITEDEAAYHPHRSLLLRVLNGQPSNDPDLTMVKIAEGDRLLFCSDGLCGFVTDEAIGERLATPDRDAALTALLGAALDAGGLDNITIVVADVVTEEPTTVPAPLMLGAATEVEIPPITVEARVIDLGDDEDTPNRRDKPVAPAPRASESEEDDRYAPRKPPRWRWFRRVVLFCVALLVLLGLGGAGVAWSRTQYYLGPAGDQVAIYQGLPDRVPLIPMSRLYEVQQLNIADLPEFYAEQVRSNSITATTLEQMRQSVTTLKTAAQECVEQRRSPPPQSSASGSRPPSGSPASPSSSTSASTSASPTVNPTVVPTGSIGPGQGGSC